MSNQQELASSWSSLEDIQVYGDNNKTVSSQSIANNIIRQLPSKRAIPSEKGSKKTHKPKKRGRDMAKIHPEESKKAYLNDPDIKALRDRGIIVRDVEDEEDLWKIIQMIKMLPCPLAEKRKFRAKLTEKQVRPLGGFDGWKHRRKMDLKRFKFWRRDVAFKLELWGKQLKRVEGHQGTGVLSYFTFLRTMFKLNIAIFAIVFGFITVPVMAFSAFPDFDYHVIGDGSVGGVDSSNTAVCSANYTNVYSSSAADVIKDFLQGTGWMEQTALFYGWYYPSDLQIGSTNANYTTPLAYLMTSIVVFLMSLIYMARSTVTGFREQLTRQTEKGKFKFSSQVFSSWDYGLEDEGNAQTKHKTIHKMILAELAEDEAEEKRRNATGSDKCRLYTIRVLMNFIIVCLLAASGYLIYYVVDFSSTYTSSDKFLELLVQYLPSITIGVLNGIGPLLFQIIAKAEKYRPSFLLKIHLFRIVFLKMASVAIIVISMYTLISCGTKDATCNVNTGSCTELKCWETYVGQSFFKLIVTDLAVSVLVVFCIELPRKLITTKCSSKFLQKIGPAEFDIPKSVLDIVYSQMLCWLGFMFAPLVTPIVVLNFLIRFYVKLFSALYSTGPQETPYKAARSNSFFMLVLMLAFYLCAFPVGYAMVKIAPSKGCGPFRVYNYMTVIIDVTIDNLPPGLNTVVSLITSTSFVLILVVFLSLVIYYCSACRAANKKVVQVLEEQLRMESKDKRFLMAKLYDVTGDTGVSRNKPLPVPKTPEKARIVNEISNGKANKVGSGGEYDKEEIKLPKPTSTNVPGPPFYSEPSNLEQTEGKRQLKGNSQNKLFDIEDF